MEHSCKSKSLPSLETPTTATGISWPTTSWERYFTYVDAGKPARLCRRFLCVQVKFAIYKGQQQRMALTAITSAWHTITPFFAADSAFPLAPTTMKCYAYDNTLLPHWKKSFNYSLIRTRQEESSWFCLCQACGIGMLCTACVNSIDAIWGKLVTWTNWYQSYHIISDTWLCMLHLSETL